MKIGSGIRIGFVRSSQSIKKGLHEDISGYREYQCREYQHEKGVVEDIGGFLIVAFTSRNGEQRRAALTE